MAKKLDAVTIAENAKYAQENEGWSTADTGHLVSPNGKTIYLPARQLGGWNDPEVQRKALETRTRNAEEKRKRKEAAMTGFGHSALSDPVKQAMLIDRLYDWAIGDDLDLAKFALKQLNDMGITKQPAEKAEVDEPTKAENMSIEDATAILMRAQKDDMKK